MYFITSYFIYSLEMCIAKFRIMMLVHLTVFHLIAEGLLTIFTSLYFYPHGPGIVVLCGVDPYVCC